MYRVLVSEFTILFHFPFIYNNKQIHPNIKSDIFWKFFKFRGFGFTEKEALQVMFFIFLVILSDFLRGGLTPIARLGLASAVSTCLCKTTYCVPGQGVCK